MAENVLEYSRQWVRQETGWWCGPASTQTVLLARGIFVEESQLAREIGTTWNGTDFVGLIEPVLNAHLGADVYVSRYLEWDPATPEQVARLWDDIVRSIDAGFGVVANIVAPPGNWPRGVKGSVSPQYGPAGATVYHYVAIMGYDDEARAVWVADSGFPPFGYWLGFDQLATLIPPKGYACAPIAPPPPEHVPAGLTPEVLADAMGGTVSMDRYRQLFPAVVQALQACDCTTVERAAMWFAQVGHEGGGLRYMEEIRDGSAYEWRQDLGNVYPGDGPRFKGRGPIQITGRHNYTRLSEWAFQRGLCPSPTFFVDLPHELASDRYGFVGVTWYWTTARDMNSYADARDIHGATRAVNGGTNGLTDRIARWNRCLAIGAALIPEEGIMAALTPDEQRELLENTRYIRAQLAPKDPSWSDASSLGKNSAGEELTLRDGIAEMKRKAEQK
ncbi:C39 family peptidase [Nocardia asteroides]|uniref:C39 family peptidase n=1 Tax=Nocardia asteroides TaxID=1824 RepID=UPI00340A4F4B